MSIVLQSSGGGSVTVQEPTTASNFTQTLPAGTGTVVVSGINSAITADTAKTATSTSVDFTGIPSWVRRITVMLNGVSTNGTSAILVQLGTSGGFVSSGYVSTAGQYNFASNTAGTSSTAGFLVYSIAAANLVSGHVLITNITGNTWVSSNYVKTSTAAVGSGAGDVALSGTLTQVRITTVNGTDTFDAGTINILYE